MNRRAVLTAYDDQVRRRPEVEGPSLQVERDEGIVRVMSSDQGWAGVTWSDLDATTADGAIAAQVDRFAQIADGWEWKHHSYDWPVDLPDRLLAAGLLPESSEALMVAELAELALDVPPPVGVRLLEVQDRQGIDAVVMLHDEVFGGDHSGIGAALATALDQRSDAVRAVVAVAGKTPIGAGRVALPANTEFASLWGGGVAPAWRGRGVFRALVAHRAAMAAAAGFRYLQVDASADSQPILKRLGFDELATTTPFLYTRRD